MLRQKQIIRMCKRKSTKHIKDYPDATIYYQKIEDIKFGYEMDDGKRIINGEEIRGGFFKDNPY